MSGLYQRKNESLGGLTDVDITNIQNKQAPVYNATQEVYTNQTILTPADLPSGSSGDVIISNGTGGIESTINLNVNSSNGNITGSFVNVSSTTIKLGQGSLTATDAVGIGWNAGFGSSNLSVSVGSASGTNAGSSSVSLGFGAQAKFANCIVLNATGSGLLSAIASSCKIAPIRNVNATTLTSPFVVQYDDTTKEVIKSEDLHIRDIKNRDIQNDGTLTNVGTASLYNGQLTIGVTPNKIVAGGVSNNLVVDIANNRVGINNATPAEALDVNGNVKLNGTIEVSNGVGTAGQVLSSNAGSPATWINQTSYTPVFAGASVSKGINGIAETTLDTWSSQVANGVTIASTNTFTTPTSGWYSLGFSFECQGVSPSTFFTTAILRIKRNGTNYHALQDNDNPAGGSDLNLSVAFGGSILIQMTAPSDYITFSTEVNSGAYLVTGFASLVKVS